MVEKEFMNVIKSYNSAVRTWANVFASWSQPRLNFPAALETIDMNRLSQPFRNRLTDWRRINEVYLQMMMGVCFPRVEKPLNGKRPGETKALKNI